MAQNFTSGRVASGKNPLWDVYQDANTLVKDEIILELKKANLYRHWYTTASKEGYDLQQAKAPLRDIFTKLLPESAPLFFGTMPVPDHLG